MTGLAHVDGDVVNRQMQARNAASQVFFWREADLADHILIVPSHQIPRVQEV